MNISFEEGSCQVCCEMLISHTHFLCVYRRTRRYALKRIVAIYSFIYILFIYIYIVFSQSPSETTVESVVCTIYPDIHSSSQHVLRHSLSSLLQVKLITLKYFFRCLKLARARSGPYQQSALQHRRLTCAFFLSFISGSTETLQSQK